MGRELDVVGTLSDGIRLRVVVLLQGAVLCVKCMMVALKLRQSTLSRQLSIMRRSGVLKCDRGGKHSYYSLNFSGDFGSLKKKMALAVQKELTGKEPYKSDKKRLVKLAQTDCGNDCVVPGGGKKGNKLLEKFGWGAIFFASWIPVIGDFILISAGAKKMKFTKFIAFMVSGKIVKTIAVVSGFALVF